MAIGPGCSSCRASASPRARSLQRSASPSHFQLCPGSSAARCRHSNSISRQPTRSFTGHLPGLGCGYATPADAIASLDPREPALCFWEEATIGLTDVLPGVRRRNRWWYRIPADRALQNCVEGQQMKRGCKGARRRSAAGQSGRKRPTRAPDSDAAHPLLAR
jgi:hypothetical protein